MRNILPAYRPDAISKRDSDRDTIIGSATISELSSRLFGMEIDQALSETGIQKYLNGPEFNSGADYFRDPEFTNSLAGVLSKLYQAAASFGFPNAPSQHQQESRIDISLSITLIETLESCKLLVYPYQANDRLVQAFMTQRVLPLITYWRWKVVTRKTLSLERVTGSVRNYFYTLWLSGWLFDKGDSAGGERWDLLHSMSADSLVQIIERSGIGYRKGFAQAIASERKNRSLTSGGPILDLLVRGSMKRAVFTFSTSAMPDDEGYYKEIGSYLFDWAEKNYLPGEEDDGY